MATSSAGFFATARDTLRQSLRVGIIEAIEEADRLGDVLTSEEIMQAMGLSRSDDHGHRELTLFELESLRAKGYLLRSSSCRWELHPHRKAYRHSPELKAAVLAKLRDICSDDIGRVLEAIEDDVRRLYEQEAA